MIASSNEGRKWTTAESLRHETAVEQLMMVTFGRAAVIRALTPPPPKGLGLSKHRVTVLYDRVKARWDEEGAAHRAENKAAQQRRIMGYIRDAQGRRDPATGAWIERPNHSALARHERLLAEILGTLAPLEVSVDVAHHEAMVAVFASYTEEDLRELHEAAERKHQLAERWLEAHPEDRAAIIDVEGEAAE